MSFRGNNPTRIDEKGRLKMPADLKRRIDEVYGRRFYITSRTGERAEIYPMREWEKIEDEPGYQAPERGEDEVRRDQLLGGQVVRHG